MATPGTLDQYSFRQQRRRTPDSKEPVIKPESKPHTTQQQQHQGKTLDRPNFQSLRLFNLILSSPLTADQSTSADDIAILKAFDLEYTYGPAVGGCLIKTRGSHTCIKMESSNKCSFNELTNGSR